MTSSCFVMRITPTRIHALPFTVSGIEHCTRRLLNNVLIYKKYNDEFIINISLVQKQFVD